MKRVLITGAQGQLGRAVNELLMNQNKYEVILTDSSHTLEDGIQSLDITEEEAVKSLLFQLKPDYIINCAAMTAVDLCESEEEKAYRINALGPKFLASAADHINATLLHISTDYVFDGQGTRPYVEEDPTNPVSVYGKTKLLGEKFVIEACKKAYIIRTAWLYGEGKNFVKTMLALAEKGNKLRVVKDQIGSPTSAKELARVILYLMETDHYGVYHGTAEGSASWCEFAQAIFQEVGLEVEVEPIPTSEYPTPAKRPMYSVLDNKALREIHGYHMKDWKDGLREYIREINEKRLYV